MTIKEFLNEMMMVSKEIKCSQTLLQALASSLYKVNSSISGMPSNPLKDPHRHEGIQVKYLDLEKEIKAKEDYLETMKEKLLLAMRLLSKPMYIKVINLRYIEGKTWVVVADKLNITARYAHKLEKAALKEMPEIE